MTGPSSERTAKAACGCFIEWDGEWWHVSASSFLCDHKQGDLVNGAPPSDPEWDERMDWGKQRNTWGYE